MASESSKVTIEEAVNHYASEGKRTLFMSWLDTEGYLKLNVEGSYNLAVGITFLLGAEEKALDTAVRIEKTFGRLKVPFSSGDEEAARQYIESRADLFCAAGFLEFLSAASHAITAGAMAGMPMEGQTMNLLGCYRRQIRWSIAEIERRAAEVDFLDGNIFDYTARIA